MSYNDEMVPRVFSVVTSSSVTYNMDFVEYLIKQEEERRVVAGEPVLSSWERDEFRRDLIRTLVLKGDANGAVALRPTKTNRSILLG